MKEVMDIFLQLLMHVHYLYGANELHFKDVYSGMQRILQQEASRALTAMSSMSSGEDEGFLSASPG